MRIMTQSNLGKDGLIARDSGSWVKTKLHYLKRYLDIFSVGMKNKWAGRLYYVDLFAGPGKCLIRDTAEEIDGSPLIALDFDFSQYFFFEDDSECFEALRKRTNEKAPNKNVTWVFGDCNETISETHLG
jgi:three-Cys-motif partner protein